MDANRQTSTLHAVFEQVVQRHPDRPAVVDGDSRLTYRELAARARAVAGALDVADVRGGLVGVRAERGAALVAGILGILMSGAAYVPMDTDLPADRVRYIARDAGLRAVLVDEHDDTVAQPGVPVIDLGAALAHAPLSGPPAGSAGDLAYVIYTSGSTGMPKGVMVEHAQVLALLEAAGRMFDLGERDVWTLFHSPAFDFSVWELFGALLTGAAALVVPKEVTRSPARMWDLIERAGVTVLNQTPTAFARLARDGAPGAGRTLRYVIFGGEALEFSRLRPWYEHHPEHTPTLVNMYGITETTVHVTLRRLTKADTSDSRSLIGAPLPHLAVRVLGPGLEPVPDGEVGEICVGGTGLARGYLNRDELTAQRFVHVGGARLYRSGDLGRRVEGGELEYAGRLDDQVKIRGYRIELGEIRHWLRARPDVADVAVTTWDEPDAGRRLVAYLLAAEGCTMAPAAQLRDDLSRNIPAYMIPSRFIPVAELPVNRNGKLDLTALPDPAQALDTPAHPPTPQATATATEIAEASAAAGAGDERVDRLLAIWRTVLGYPDVQADDRFYAVGGDSIQAIRVAAAAGAEGIKLSIEDLMANPTPRDLAARADTAQDGERRTEPFSLLCDEDRRAVPHDVEDAYPVAPLQMAMLFYGDDDEAKAYHSVSSATVNRPFDRERMTRCLRTLLARHETLRTRFDLAGFTVPLQLVQREAPVPLAVDDLSARPAHEQDAAVAALLERERADTLDCECAPMIRFRALVLDADRFVFVWSEHHAILDGWSSNRLFTEVMQAYGTAQPPAPDAPAPPPLRDYVAAELDAIASPQHRAFWAEYLRGVSPARPPGSARAVSGAVRELAIPAPPGAYESLRTACRTADVTPKALLMAVAATALAAERDADEVIVGHVTHGRLNRPGAQDALGMFLNTVPLRAAVTGSFLEIARRIAADLERSGPHRRYPLLHIQRAAGVSPLLDNVLNFVDFHQLDPLARSGLIGSEGVRNWVRISIPLTIEACRRPATGELEVSVQFQGAAWDRARATAFAGVLTRTLERALRAPHETAPGRPRERTAIR